MKPDRNKIVSRLKIWVTIACLLSGLLAGENVFRYVMEVPGWRHIDITNWGEYSRNADLKGGIIILPFEAIVSALLFVFSSVAMMSAKHEFQSVAWPLHSATIFSIVGLVLTFFAAPYMLNVQAAGNNPELLQQAFDHFHFWGLLRAIAQVFSFFACVLAIGKIYELHPDSHAKP